MVETVDVAIVDRQGRLYLKEKIRKISGIKSNSTVEIIAREGEIVIRPKKSIARESKGAFKLKRKFKKIKNIDQLIDKLSLLEALGEL